MNKDNENILELIANEEVEWKKLDEIINTILSTKKIKKGDYLSEGQYPIIDQGLNYISGYTNDSKGLFHEDEYIIFGDHTEIVKYINFSFFQGADGIKVIQPINDSINTKYLYYTIIQFYKKQGEYKRHFKELKNTKVPMPSLKLQEKIVYILDKLTLLQAELQAELQYRTKQYIYYREHLLSIINLNKLAMKNLLEGEYEIKEYKLEEVCEILDAKRKPISKNNRVSGKYPYYGANGIQDYVDDYIFDGTYILMGEDGSVIDENNNPILHWVDNKKIWVNNHAHVLGQLNEEYNLRYIYYYLSKYNVSTIVRGLPPKINQENLRNIKITLPPIIIQNIIVEILDKLKSLVDETQGLLPKEIKQRQKQYEYYLEKLLTFDSQYVKASKQASKQ